MLVNIAADQVTFLYANAMCRALECFIFNLNLNLTSFRLSILCLLHYQRAIGTYLVSLNDDCQPVLEHIFFSMVLFDEHRSIISIVRLIFFLLFLVRSVSNFESTA